MQVRVLGTPLVCVSIGIASLAHAGLSEVPLPESIRRVTTEPTGRGARPIEEIIVTAQRRAQRLEDVPLSISVVSAADIDERGLVNAADYLRGTPGVNQVDAPFGQSIVIRGLETSPAFQNFSAGTTVATYFGETPTTNSQGLAGGTNVDLKLVDVERVEVLRGPQGTAFGSSSLGGVVRTIPVAPNVGVVEARAAANYSVTSDFGGDNYNAQAVGNFPLVEDKLAIRAVAYRYHDSGYYRNRAASDPAFQAAIVAPFGVGALAVNEDEVGSTEVTGGRAAVLLQPTEDLKLTVGYVKQKNETDGYALQNSGTHEQTILQVAPEHVVRGQRGGLFDTDVAIANATVEYGLGWGSLFAQYAYLTGDSMFVQPGTQQGLSTVFPPRSGIGESEHRERVGEVRLTTELGGAWNFIVGLYAESLDDDYRADARWQGVTGANPFGASFLGFTTQRRELTQKAVYGEVSWKFLPGFTLTGGARAYEFDREVRRMTSGPLFGGATDTTRTTDADGTSLRGTLSYEPSENAMIYAGWGQGFRLGQPQTGLVAGVCDQNGDGIVDGSSIAIESTRHLDSDEVESYELGTKLSFLDQRVTISAAVYLIDWTGVPVRMVAPVPGCGTFTGNAATARSQGVELQATFRMTPALRLDIGGSTVDAELTKDAPGLVPPAFDGDRLPGSPKVNANAGLQYDFAIGSYDALLRADSIYVGPFYGNLAQTPNSRAGDYVKVDTTARVTINNLTIDLFVHNLTNADDFTFRDTSGGVFYGYRLRPRTVGLQLGYAF